MKLTICKSPNGAVALRSDRGQVCEMLAGYDQTRLQDAQTIAHRVNVHDELVAALETLLELSEAGQPCGTGDHAKARAALERAKQ